MAVRLSDIVNQAPGSTPDEVSSPRNLMRLGDVVSMERVEAPEFNEGILEIPDEQRRQWESRGPIGAMEQFRRTDKTELLPFNPESAVRSVGLLRAVNRLRDDKTLPDQRKKDEDLVSEYLMRLEEERVRGVSFGGKVVKGVAPLPAFMVEFIATGPVYSFAKTGVRKAIQGAASAMVERGALKFATRAGGAVLGATARTAAMPHGIVDRYAERQTDAGLELTEKGMQIAKEVSEKPKVSAMKAFGDLLIENFSEVTGPAISKASSYVAPKILKNGLEKIFARLRPNEKVAKLWETAGYNGFLEEMGEERVGAFLRAVTGVDDFGADNPDSVFDRVIASIPNGEELLVEAAVLTVPGLGRVATSQIVDGIKKARESSKLPLPELKEITDEQADAIVATGSESPATGASSADVTKQVRDNIQAQLELSGVPEEAALLQAKVYEERIRRRAELRGEDPIALFDSLGLLIQKADAPRNQAPAREPVTELTIERTEESGLKVDGRGLPVRRDNDVVATVRRPDGVEAPITHRMILDEAAGLQIAARDQEDVADPLAQFVMENGGVKGFRARDGKAAPESEEFRDVPLVYRGVRRIDEMAQDAYSAGLLEEPSADLLRERLKNAARTKVPRLADLYAEAQRDLENYFSTFTPEAEPALAQAAVGDQFFQDGLFAQESENVATAYARIHKQAMDQGMNYAQASKYAKERLKTLKPVHAAPAAKQTEFGAGDGVQGFGTGRKGDLELFQSKLEAAAGLPDYRPNTKLTGKAAQDQARGAAYASKNLDKILGAYGRKHGTYVSTDALRDLLKPAGYNGTNSDAFHEPARALRAAYERDLLARAKADGRTDVLIMAGGSASGKTSFLDNALTDRGRYGMILDATLSGSGAADLVKNLQAQGFSPSIIYVHRDPVEAVRGVISRMKTEKRVVPIHEHVKMHRGARDTVVSFLEGGAVDVPVTLIRNVQNEGFRTATLEEIKAESYTGLEEKANEEYRKALDEKRISKAQFEAAVRPEGSEQDAVLGTDAGAGKGGARENAGGLPAGSQQNQSSVTPTDPAPGQSSSATPQTESPAFKKWFGDSKVVDQDGRPLVMYHGRPRSKNFERFKVSSKDGAYFSSDPNYAEEFSVEFRAEKRDPLLPPFAATGTIMPVYLSIQNPLNISENEVERFIDRGYDKREIAAQGYDGIILRYPDGEVVAMAFEPAQIKSAIGNRGTFDGGNPNILYQESRSSARPQTETPAFKNWFGDSKVVDENGKPLVVYHGTNASFNEFAMEKGGYSTGAKSARQGAWFVSRPDVATGYAHFAAKNAPVQRLLDAATAAEKKGDWTGYDDFLRRAEEMEKSISSDPARGQSIVPVYLSMKNPLEVDAKGGSFTDLEEMIHRSIADAKRFGRDGIVIRNLDDDPGFSDRVGDHFLVFDPTQIKSAIGNSGTFDPSNPNILYQAPTFFSAVERTLTEKMPAKASADQILGMLKNAPGVKQEEIDGLDLPAFLQGQTGMIDKQTVLDFVKQGGVKIEEVTKGGNDLIAQDAVAQLERMGWTVGVEENVAEGGQFISQIEGPNGEFFDRTEFSQAPADVKKILDKAVGTEKSQPKFERYALPGGENYRELLFTLPEKMEPPAGFDVIQSPGGSWMVKFPDGLTLGGWNTREAAIRSQRKQAGAPNFQSSHFDEPNVLAHVRFNERTDSEGKRVLFIEEVQSDWHQKGRDQGYKGDEDRAFKEFRDLLASKGLPNDDVHLNILELQKAGATPDVIARFEAAMRQVKGTPVPDAPFKKTWHELVLKRMLRWAAENNFERIAWTTGEQQAERYDLSKQISEVRLETPNLIDGKEHFSLFALDLSGRRVLDKYTTAEELPDIIGKETASKLLATPWKDVSADIGEPGDTTKVKVLRGLDLKVGGEGMKGFYDQIIPSFLNKYTKKWGGRVGSTEIGEGQQYRVVAENGQEVTFDAEAQAQAWLDDNGETGTITAETSSPIKVNSLDITPAMKDAVLNAGQPLFQDEQAPRGSIEFQPNRIIINLFKNADRSTFLHETGHLWMKEIQEDYAFIEGKGRENLTPGQLKFLNDTDRMFAWLGAKAGDTLTREQQEKWARGVEAYFRGGFSPSAALKDSFERFRLWLRSIYQSAKDLGVDLTPEMRNYMASLLASPTQTTDGIDGEPPMTAEQAYAENRKRAITPKTDGLFSKLTKGAAQGADEFIGVISTRLKNINPAIKSALRKFELDHRQRIQEDLAAVESLLRGSKRMTARDAADFDLARKNGHAEIISTLARKYDIDMSRVRATLDNIHSRAREVGFDIGFLGDYHPRIVKDVEGLLAYWQQDAGRRSSLLEAVREKEAILHRILTSDEKVALINELLRGVGRGIRLGRTGNMFDREIVAITPDLNEFYFHSDEALMRYIQKVNEAIEARRFFGKGSKELEFNNVDESVGAYTLDLLERGEIEPEDEAELRDILKARFNYVGTQAFAGFYKNVTYLSTIANPISAISNLEDLAISAYRAPLQMPGSFLRAFMNRSKISMDDIGIDNIAEELREATKSASLLRKALYRVGFTKFDRIGKETLVNAVIDRYRNQAKKPTKEFRERLSATFGTDQERVIADLAAGKTTYDVQLLAFNELLEVQPVALSEMPQKYLENPGGRVFYSLKTFTIKRLDYLRNEVIQKASEDGMRPKIEAIRRFLHLYALLAIFGAGVDELKDFLLNRKTEISDRVVDNMLKPFGITKFLLYSARREGPATAISKFLFLPPVKLIDAIYRDVFALDFEEEGVDMFVGNLWEGEKLEVPASIPVGGKLYYWWLGAGSEKD